MSLSRAEIETEVDSLVDQIPKKLGVREILLALRLAQEGLPVDQRCPSCGETLNVTPFTHGFQQGAFVKCGCRTCTTDFRGL
jgi:hypothetical protein